MDDSVFMPDESVDNKTNKEFLSLNKVRINLDSITMSSPKLTNKESDHNLRRPSETSSLGSPGKFRAPYCIGGGALEMLIEPVDEESIYEERSTKWEYKNVHLNRVAGYGFGIAVSGGRDNPHFKSGEPSIVVSDVLQGGPAADLLKINDRIITANGINLENADYSTAVQIMKDSDQLNLIIRRRVPLPVVEYEQKTLKFTLTKTKKKDDFGVVLGCKFYIKSITNKKLAEKEPGLREGDAVVKINDVSCDDLTMTEARKLLDKSRERLSMVIKRDVPRGTAWKWSSQATLYEKLGNETPGQSPTPRQSPMVSCRLNDDSSIEAEAVYGVSGQIRSRYSRYCSNSQPVSRSRTPSQNVYDQSESYGSFQPRNNVSSSGVHVPVQNPAASFDDVSQSSSSVQVSTNNDLSSNNRPPLVSPLPEPRFVSFCKEGGSVGVRVIGGNEVGIFVSAVQVNSPAAVKGVRTGDKILRANDRDMRHVTREEAVLHLLSLVDQVDLILQYKRDEFDMIRSQNLGDNFFIRVHFDYDHDSNKEKNGLCFKKGDVFQIVDTLYAGTVGWWQAVKIAAISEKSNDEPSTKGVIPNLSKAEQIMANEKARIPRVSRTGVNSNSSGTGSLLRKKMTLTKRSKSMSKSGSSECVFPQIAVNFPAYERVQLKHPGFLRPVILYGPLADIAAEKLLQDFALRFANPKSLGYCQDNSNNVPDVNGVKLSTIKEIMNKNKHCLLDVSPTSIEKLQYAQFCPIVIFLNVDNRSRLRELRRKVVHSKSDLASKSTKKLMEDANKLQKCSRRLFTAVLDATNRFDWFDALRELISHLQDRRVWMSETRPTDVVDDAFLFSLGSDSHKKLMDSDGEDQSDSYGTLTARRAPNVHLQAKTNGNSDNYNSINDSEISSEISQPVSSEGESNLRQESSKNSTPDIPSDANDTTKIASSEACNSSNTLVVRTTEINSATNGFSSDRMSSSSYGSSAMQNYSLKQQPTNENSPIINQLTNEMNETFQSITGMNEHCRPRTTRHMSEPGFYDVRQILQNHTPDFTNNAHNYGMSQRIPYYPIGKRSDLNNGPNAGSTPPFNSQTAQPENESGYSYQQNGTSRIRPRLISRTPSNPAPSLTNHHASRNYGFYSPSPRHLLHHNNNNDQQLKTSSPYRNGGASGPIYGDYTPVSTSNINYQRMGAFPNGSDSPRVRPPPPPAPSTPRSPHATPARLTSTSAATTFSVTSAKTATGPHAIASNVNVTTEGKNLLAVDAMTHPDFRHQVNRNFTGLAVKEDYVEVTSLPLPNDSGNTSSSTESNVTTIRRRPVYSASDVIPYSNDPNNSQTTSAPKMAQSNFVEHGLSASKIKPPLAAKPNFSRHEPVSNVGQKNIILAHVRQIVGPEGGTLVSESTQVVLKIPPGALDTTEEIFFKVFQDSRYEPPLDRQKGEQLLSPLLMLGPQGLTFRKPVELLLPHNVAGGSTETSQWCFVVKKTTPDLSNNNHDCSNNNGSDASLQKRVDWQHISLSDLNTASSGQSNDSFSKIDNDRPHILSTIIDGKFASINLHKF